MNYVLELWKPCNTENRPRIGDGFWRWIRRLSIGEDEEKQKKHNESTRN